MSKKYLYKFLMPGLKSNYDGSQWKVGEWREVPAPERECEGLNASEYIQDALGYVQGKVLAKVECGGKIIKGDDKWTCEKMRIVSVADWGKTESVKMAIFCAELCISNFEKLYPDDDGPRKAIKAAKEWLKKPSNETDRAADSAARAADSAARAADSAARAAYSAVYSAARAADSAARAAYSASRAARAAYSAVYSAARAADSADRAARGKIHKYILSFVTWRKE